MEKNAIITGGSGGLGRAIAVELAANKDIRSITLIARDFEKLSDTSGRISEINRGCQVDAVTGDFSDRAGIENVITKLRESHRSYNILINNAGFGEIGSLEEVANDKIEQMMYVNLMAPLLLTKYFLAQAREQHWGRIINISTISIFSPSVNLTPYIVSKSGLDSMSRCVTLSDLENGITCNTICPGLMLTDAGKAAIRYSFPNYNEYTNTYIESTLSEQFPARKFTEPEEIAGIISFLISHNGGSISGEIIRSASGIL